MTRPEDKPVNPLDAPFTPEQMEYLWKRDIELSEHGTDWSRRHLRSYARRATAAFLALAIGIGAAFYSSDKDSDDSRKAIVKSGRVVSVDGCNRDYESREVLRGLLIQAQKLSKKQFEAGKMTADQYKVAQDYYTDQLAAAPLLDCRPAATLITDDPSDITKVPEPLFPPPKPYTGPH